MPKRFFMLLSLLAAFAVQADESYPEVRQAVAALVPNLEIDAIQPAPIEGYVEVLLGANLIYVSEDGQYLIDGQLIEISTRRNLSEDSKGDVRKNMLGEVEKGQRIVFPAQGETRHRIAIFTDIDCGYCRRLHQQMAEYNELGIEVDYLFFPRAGVPSASYDKAVSVWCANDRNQALTDAKAGSEPPKKECSNPVERHFQLGKEMGVTGTPAMVAEDGTMIPGYVPPATLLARLDSLSAQAKAE